MDNLENLDPNQINQLIGLLQSMLPKVANKQPKKKTTNTKTSKRSKSAVDNDRENRFMSMPEMNMHKSDSIIDKKLNKFPPTPRLRDSSLIKVVCRVCGKKAEVSPKLIPESVDRYKCNNCSSTQG